MGIEGGSSWAAKEGGACRASVDLVPGVCISSVSVFRDCWFRPEHEGCQGKCLWWAGKRVPGSPQLDLIRSAVSQKLGPLHLEPGKDLGSRDHRSL